MKNIVLIICLISVVCAVGGCVNKVSDEELAEERIYQRAMVIVDEFGKPRPDLALEGEKDLIKCKQGDLHISTASVFIGGDINAFEENGLCIVYKGNIVFDTSAPSADGHFVREPNGSFGGTYRPGDWEKEFNKFYEKAQKIAN